MVRTFLHHLNSICSAVRRRGGQLLLITALLLCVWTMTTPALGAQTQASYDYLFEVTTGAKTGDEDKIDFFIITYTTANSGDKTVSKFLFPSKDGWEQTYETVSAINNTQTQRDKTIRDTYGYAGSELKSGRKIFQAYSTDQYLFSTPEEIKEIRRIQVFASDSGSWDCRALRVFRVSKLGGLYRSNVASSDCYIDFEGDLIAEGAKNTGANVAWQNDKLISTGVDLTLSTASALNSAYAHHSLQDSTRKTLAIRFDFADTYGAGLEALSAMSASASKLSNMGLAETMAVTLYYEDIYGLRHEVNVPAVLNAAEYVSSLLSSGDRNKAISGFAQQGESMVVGIFLPDFASLVPSEGLKVALGANEVKGVLGLTTANERPTGETRTLRTNRIALSESDTASFVTMAVYDLANTQVSASVSDSSGAIRYTFSGDPIYYQPVSTVSGAPLYIGENKLSLTPYESGKLLAPRDKTERYLMELTTDSVTGSGTRDDILMSISWTDLNGNAKTSGTLNVRELSQDLNGWWYGTLNRNGAVENGPDDIAYFQGVATGRTLRFFVPLQQVKTINDVRVWMSELGNRDDWQMKDLKISTVNSYGQRAVSWRAVSADGASSPLTFDRSVEGTLVYRFSDTAENPVLVQQDSDDMINVGPSRTDNLKSGENGGAGVDVTTTKKVDWSQLRYAMSFKQASQELGFGKERYLYAVTVHVGGNEEASAEDGDCGSKNLFYFRLIFKSGSSSFVLANQQLSSDGFIAGASQTFYIGTNQDYGDVTAVQIIPEDLSSDSDMFDKLNIKSIDIKRESNGALVPVWTVSQVGWISIDYRDEGQLQSVTGMAGRGASELTRTYLVDGSTFNVNFMLSITTEGYPEGAPQFEGNLSAIVYYDSYSPSKGYEEISDVTQSMYSYMNRTPIGMPESIGGKTISDPSLMFRADHTDRFYFSLSDVRSIKRIEFQAVSAVNTTWKISDVSLYMVNGQGSLILNQFGEYQRVYQAGEKLTELAHGTSETSPAYAQILQAYDGATNSSGQKVNDRPAVINVNFTENTIEITPEAKQWTSIVSKEPVSENDTLNVFIYPLEGTRVDASYNPVTVLQYTSSRSDTPIQKTTGDMTRTLYNNQPVFYTTGINASNLSALNSIMVRTTRGSGIQGTVRGVIQQVRSGVVIKTWELTGTGSSEIGIALGAGKTPATRRQQRVQLQLGTDTKKAALSDTGNNLAVALWYRCDDPSGMELRSPYIYLTDQGYTQIQPGQVIDLTFEQKNIAEITGIAMVSMGDVSGSVEMARVVDEEIGVETGVVMDTVGEYGFTTPARISSAPSRMAPGGNVKPLTLTFVTGSPAEGESEGGGTDAPVRVLLGYYDQYGDLIPRLYDNIQLYLTEEGAAFTTGSTRTAQLLVEDLQQLRWIELEPRHDTGMEAASWTLASIGAAVGDRGTGTDRTVNTIIREGTPLTVVFANVSLKLTATTTVDDEVTVKETIGGEEKILTKSKGTVVIAPQLTGSTSGWRVVAERVVDGFPASASSTIRINRDGDVEFTAPENKTGSAVQYRITVTSTESPDVKAIMNIGVESEPEPEPVVTTAPVQSEGGSGSSGSSSGSGGTTSETTGDSTSGTTDPGETEGAATSDAAGTTEETGNDTAGDSTPTSGDETGGTSDDTPASETGDTGTEVAGSGDTGTDSEEG